jgi:hypothetical protein
MTMKVCRWGSFSQDSTTKTDLFLIPEFVFYHVVSMTFWKPCVDLDGRFQEHSHCQRGQPEQQCVSICRLVWVTSECDSSWGLLLVMFGSTARACLVCCVSQHKSLGE